MKKSECIDRLVELGQDRKEMEGMNYNDLRKLLKELESQKKEEEKDVGEKEVVEEKGEEKSEEFESMCGFPFDPSKSSGCYKQCRKDYPENYEACREHFKKAPAKKTEKSGKKGLGMNKWHHRPGSQAARIDEMLWEGGPVTMDRFIEELKTTRARIMSHLGHLVQDWGQDIRKCEVEVGEEKKEAFFWKEGNTDLDGTPVKGRTAYPKGFPKTHPLYKGE